MRARPCLAWLRRGWRPLLLVLLVWMSPVDTRADDDDDDDQFLLRVTSRAEADALAARYRLTIVREVRPGELYRVKIDDDRTDDEVEAEVGADVRAIGIERNRARVVVGPDAHAVNVVARLLPGRSGLVGRITNRLLGSS